METNFGSYCRSRCNNRTDLINYAAEQTRVEDKAKKDGMTVAAGSISCQGTVSPGSRPSGTTYCAAKIIESGIVKPGEPMPNDSARYKSTQDVQHIVPGFQLDQTRD